MPFFTLSSKHECTSSYGFDEDVLLNVVDVPTDGSFCPFRVGVLSDVSVGL